jgi:peptide deformylase
MDYRRMIIEHTDPVLHSKCEEFSFENPQTNPSDLAKTLIVEKASKQALGLAANQIGVPLRVFAFLDEVAFNPEVMASSEIVEPLDEGCLSYPGLWIIVRRPVSAQVKYYLETGQLVERHLNELETRVFLHELDHLNGVTMVDHASDFKVKRAIVKAKKVGHEYTIAALRNRKASS